VTVPLKGGGAPIIYTRPIINRNMIDLVEVLEGGVTVFLPLCIALMKATGKMSFEASCGAGLLWIITLFVISHYRCDKEKVVQADAEVEPLSLEAQLVSLHVCREEDSAALAEQLRKQGVMTIEDFSLVSEEEARDMMAHSGMSKLQQNKVIQAVAEPMAAAAAAAEAFAASRYGEAGKYVVGARPQKNHNETRR